MLQITLICLAVAFGAPQSGNNEDEAWNALDDILQTHRYPERGRFNRQAEPDYEKQLAALKSALAKTKGTTAEPHTLLHIGHAQFALNRFADSKATFESIKERFAKHGLCLLRDLSVPDSRSLVDQGIYDANSEIEIRKTYEVKALPVARISPNERVIFDTSLGSFEMGVYRNAAPTIVANFEKLVKKGFYNDLYVHRTLGLRHFVAGCPKTHEASGLSRADDGTGSPGYDLAPEFSTALHRAGSVAMLALPGSGRVHGSQFMVCVNDQPQFNNKQAVFAQIVKGQDVVKKISQQIGDSKGNPYERVWIRSARWIGGE